MLFKRGVGADGKATLHGLVANISVPIPQSPDVVIFQGKVYVLHYEGMEVYYREAQVYHYQKSAIILDDLEISGLDFPKL